LTLESRSGFTGCEKIGLNDHLTEGEKTGTREKRKGSLKR